MKEIWKILTGVYTTNRCGIEINNDTKVYLPKSDTISSLCKFCEEENA